MAVFPSIEDLPDLPRVVEILLTFALGVIVDLNTSHYYSRCSVIRKRIQDFKSLKALANQKERSIPRL